ncbi:MAG: hypothetical protein QHC90_06665 [Shinella sp.]|nr:hypothetical protein [Shinella sp.]
MTKAAKQEAEVDLGIDLSHMPALPKSGFLIRKIEPLQQTEGRRR